MDSQFWVNCFLSLSWDDEEIMKAQLNKYLAATVMGVLMISVLSWAQEFNPESHHGPLPAETTPASEIAVSSNTLGHRKLKLNLRSAIELALSHNPNVRDLSEKVVETNALPGIALAPSLPIVTADLSATYQKN